MNLNSLEMHEEKYKSYLNNQNAISLEANMNEINVIKKYLIDNPIKCRKYNYGLDSST